MARRLADGFLEHQDRPGVRRRRAERARTAAAATGGRSLVIPADVTNEKAVEDAFARVASELGGIDAVILAAGIGRSGPIESYPLADWNATLATNLTGPFLCARAAIPHLRRRGGGAIVAIASGAARQG